MHFPAVGQSNWTPKIIVGSLAIGIAIALIGKFALSGTASTAMFYTGVALVGSISLIAAIKVISGRKKKQPPPAPPASPAASPPASPRVRPLDGVHVPPPPAGGGPLPRVERPIDEGAREHVGPAKQALLDKGISEEEATRRAPRIAQMMWTFGAGEHMGVDQALERAVMFNVIKHDPASNWEEKSPRQRKILKALCAEGLQTEATFVKALAVEALLSEPLLNGEVFFHTMGLDLKIFYMMHIHEAMLVLQSNGDNASRPELIVRAKVQVLSQLAEEALHRQQGG